MIPEFTKHQIDQYVAHGICTGSFLTAVLENNLIQAFACADEDNLANMFHIVSYVYNHVPTACYGSPEKMAAWREMKRKERDGN